MHETHSLTHTKMILADVVSIAFTHMRGLALEIKKLDINADNLSTKSKEELFAAETMSHILTILNDVIHPAHDVCDQLFDKDVQEFVEYCKKNQAMAIEKKLIANSCSCYSCKMKSPIKNN